MVFGLPYYFTLIPFLVGMCFGVPITYYANVWMDRNLRRARDIRRANDDVRNAHTHQRANARLEATEHRLVAAIHRLELADARLCAMESGVPHIENTKVIMIRPTSIPLGNLNYQKSNL